MVSSRCVALANVSCQFFRSEYEERIHKILTILDSGSSNSDPRFLSPLGSDLQNSGQRAETDIFSVCYLLWTEFAVLGPESRD